ncbi:MAG: hypothetical protein KA717_07220 [Woronichinia naegeliana WA131]|uniref:Uncharacterized protein n=1 Tax=Woronichinia naegeliana WA131 TaxID=2824559 RepID=A0A977KZ19_9CYAN|nr:MAG: hypothetical protein KA717_07220 [Woronichinia naegeliana WA131]
MSQSQTRSLFIIYKTAIADQYVSVSNEIALDHLQNRDRAINISQSQTRSRLLP